MAVLLRAVLLLLLLAASSKEFLSLKIDSINHEYSIFGSQVSCKKCKTLYGSAWGLLRDDFKKVNAKKDVICSLDALNCYVSCPDDLVGPTMVCNDWEGYQDFAKNCINSPDVDEKFVKCLAESKIKKIDDICQLKILHLTCKRKAIQLSCVEPGSRFGYTSFTKAIDVLHAKCK